MAGKKQIKMTTLYDTRPTFKLYVDKYCVKHNISKEEAFQHLIVKAYAQYVIDAYNTKESE